MISNKQFRWSALLFSLLLFGLTIGASKRCAMVVETRGNNTLTVDDKSARMRTLQVLPAEAQVNVAEGAILRLSYFSSGKKEKITGPCSLRIGTGASELIEGPGRIQVQSKRDAATDLDKTDNLRRMGGALQANATDTPQSVLQEMAQKEVAMAPPPAPAPASSPAPSRSAVAPPTVERETSSAENESSSGGSPFSNIGHLRGGASKAPKPTGRTTAAPAKPAAVNFKFEPTQTVQPAPFVGLSPVYLTPNRVGEIRLKGDGKEADIELLESGKIIQEFRTSNRSIVLPSALLGPGKRYEVRLKNESDVATFRVFSTEEVDSYLSLARRVRQVERHDHRAMYAHLLLIQSELGLLRLAEATAKNAVTEFYHDPGFLFALGEIKRELNKPEEAKRCFEQAIEAEKTS